MTQWSLMTSIKPTGADQDFQDWVQRASNPTSTSPDAGVSFADQLAKAQAPVSAPASPEAPAPAPMQGGYIPSTGQGDDKNVHHRLPDGTPVTYDDIRRAVAEGRGDEDVSPHFTGQTNAQALAAHGFAETIEAAPRLVGGVAAVATRSWLSLLSSITDSFGFGEKIRTVMADESTKTKPSKDPLE
jgi:hypothetical protein